MDLRVLFGNDAIAVPNPELPSISHRLSEPPKVGRKVVSNDRLNMMPNTFEVADVEAELGLTRATAWALVKRWVMQQLVEKQPVRRQRAGVIGYILVKTGRLYPATNIEQVNVKRKEKARDRHARLLTTLPWEFTTSEAAWYWKVRASIARDRLYACETYGLVRSTGKTKTKPVTTTWMKE